MRNTALCILLLLVWSSTAVAGEKSRQIADCRALVAAVQPPTSEGEESEQYRKDADRAYRDCRSEQLPLDVRVDALLKYAETTAAREQPQSAIEALRESITLLDRAGSSDQARLTTALDRLAFHEIRGGLRTDALAHAKRAADIRAQAFGPDSAEASRGKVNLAMVYVAFQDFATTEALLRDAIRVAKKTCGRSEECTPLLDAYSGMYVLYETIGNAAEAQRWKTLAFEAAPSPQAEFRKE